MIHSVDSVVIVPTLYCSQQCEHCCRCAGPQRKERMADNVAYRLSRALQNWRVGSVTISGGEPLLMSKMLWERVIDTLPYGMDTIHMVSNGDFLERPRARYNVLHYVLPRLSEHLHKHCDLGIMIELSGDRFHSGYNAARWEQFKYAIENDYDEDGDDYSYIGLRADKISLTARGEYLDWDYLFPTGRARRLTCGNHKLRVECELEQGDTDECAQHTMTVYPDGSVRGCCNGGPVIGSIFESFDLLLERHYDFVMAVRAANQDSGDYGAPSTACLTCARIARKFYQRGNTYGLA